MDVDVDVCVYYTRREAKDSLTSAQSTHSCVESTKGGAEKLFDNELKRKEKGCALHDIDEIFLIFFFSLVVFTEAVEMKEGRRCHQINPCWRANHSGGAQGQTGLIAGISRVLAHC